MKTTLIILLLSFFLATELEAKPSETKSASSTQISLGVSHKLDSSEFESPREVNIYLPASYVADAEQRRYPVLYLIDGGQAQDFKHIAGLAALASINPYLFGEVIVVGIATENRLYELTSLNVDPRYKRAEGTLGGADSFRGFIKNSVIPFIENNYRTNKQRLVMGESLAGLFIVESYLKTPALFDDYIAVSPSLWFDDRELAKQAPDLLSKHQDKPKRIYLTIANEGGTMQQGLDEIRQAIQTSELENSKVKYVDRSQDEFHWTIYHGAALDALRWTLPTEKPAYLDEPDPWYLIEGANPPLPPAETKAKP